MTVQDKIEALRQEFLERLSELEAEASNEQATCYDVLDKYIKYLDGDHSRYYLDGNSDICAVFRTYECVSDKRNPYQLYPTADLARLAYAHKRYNDMLLAFKYCYDCDYCPDWEGFDNMYSVGFNHKKGKYDVITLLHDTSASVIFSTEEIAQKCADWLNAYPEFAPKRLYHECDM